MAADGVEEAGQPQAQDGANKEEQEDQLVGQLEEKKTGRANIYIL